MLAWRAATRDVVGLARWAQRCSQAHEAGAGDLPFVGCLPHAQPAPTQAHRTLAARQYAALQQLGLQVLLPWQLPTAHRQLAAPPLALFVRGNAALLQQTAWAIVGARRAHPGPRAWAFHLAERCARAGILVVSGGALGIDAAAHAGALAANAPTLAYMGSAIDRIYPALNAPLFRRLLAAGGALVSEHPPLAVTYKSAHALRNRLIAAHAQALVVAEAQLGSGTLSAVRFARRLQRPVYCAPADAGGERSGLDFLLRRGWAQPLASPPALRAGPAPAWGPATAH